MTPQPAVIVHGPSLFVLQRALLFIPDEQLRFTTDGNGTSDELALVLLGMVRHGQHRTLTENSWLLLGRLTASFAFRCWTHKDEWVRSDTKVALTYDPHKRAGHLYIQPFINIGKEDPTSPFEGKLASW